MRKRPGLDSLAKMRLKQTTYKGTQECVARVVLSFRFYIPLSNGLSPDGWSRWDAGSEGIIEGIKRYRCFLRDEGTEAGWKYWSASTMRPLTPRGFTRILSTRANVIEFDGHRAKVDESIGEYGISARLSAGKILKTYPNYMAHLRLDFPLDSDSEKLAALFSELVDCIPLQSANAGFTFKQEPARWRANRNALMTKLRTWWGVAPGFHSAYDSMLGKTYCAHWMNALSRGMFEKLSKFAPPTLVETSMQERSRAFIFRTSHHPLPGNVQKGTRTLGGLTEVADFLRPLRQVPSWQGHQDWLARFDS